MKKIILNFFIIASFSSLYGRKMIVKQRVNPVDNVYKNHWFDIKPLNFILQNNANITYEKCFDRVYFNYKQLPFSINPAQQPNQGFLNPTFILKIPNGMVQGFGGTVLIDNHFIDEMVWRKLYDKCLDILEVGQENIKKISGRVAVISQPAYENYFHWTTEVLGRLALLEMFNIEYDYLYVPQDSKYMKETLHLWGIPEEKIIAPTSNEFVVQADEVILPSLVANTNHGFRHLVNYIHPYVFEYVRTKLASAAKIKENINFYKRIFISRKDSKIRNVINEDEIFEQLIAYGFVRYELSELSVVDQIQLFRQAEIIVSPQGTGLTNIMYCNPSVKIIELYQGLCDSAIFNMAQMLNLKLIPISTIPFEHDFIKAWLGHTHMSVSIIEKIKKYLE